jgi:S-(hydroxymethyl)glutathione dehydrogenase / alcohol dehydrogenase
MKGKEIHVKALVLNAVGRRFELEEIDIANPTGREVLVDVQGSGLCHTDLLFATHEFVPVPAVLGHEAALKDGSLHRVVVTSF